MNGRDRILAMLEGRPVDRLPLMPYTIMLAADQIGVPFRQYAADYRRLVDAQIHMAEKFDFDHVTCVSDPAKRPTAAGRSTISTISRRPSRSSFPAGRQGRPRRAEGSRSRRRRANARPRPGGRAVQGTRGRRKTRRRLDRGPLAEAADLRGINRLMTDFFDDPPFVRDLFAFVLEMEVPFAKAQIEAGAELIGIGDAAASLVGPAIYEEFVRPCEQQMIDAVHALGAKVRLHICGNVRRILPGIATLGCDLIDIDWLVPLDQARRELGPRQVLSGNIDPVAVMRNGTPESITRAIAECHRQAGPHYVVSAGCEVPRDTPVANLLALRDYVRAVGGGEQ